MPISERDRKTLTIGGGVVGFLLVVFLIYKVFLSGGTDVAATSTPTLPPVSPAASPSPSATPTPTPTGVGVVTFGGHDPFCVPQSYVSREVLLHLPLDATAYYCPGVFVPSSSPSASGSSSPSGSGSPSNAPSAPIGSSVIIGGRAVVLMGPPSGQGSRTQVEVNGKVYFVTVGSTFGGGSFRFQGTSGSCASFLYGDQPFSLCHA